MKLFFLLITAVFVLLATNPSESTEKTINSGNENACCNKNKCCEKEKQTEQDDFILFQLSPFHI
jgi:hypothetical protein